MAAAEQSRAAQVLEKVLVRASDTMASGLVVIDSWVETNDVFCLVYRYDSEYFYEGVLGLRRTVEPDWTIAGVAEQVLIGELGEPLGTMMDELVPDAEGVMWWTGDKPEWRGPPR